MSEIFLTKSMARFVISSEAMKTLLSLRRNLPVGMSVLELRTPETDIQIKILSHLEKRERRALLRAFFHQIKPLLQDLEDAAVEHSGDGLIRRKRSRERQFRSFQSVPIQTTRGALGFEIRMKRLSFGLSQAELACKVGISRPHLSDIERGLYLPGPRVRARLIEVLKMGQH